jgi:hypothetical protein
MLWLIFLNDIIHPIDWMFGLSFTLIQVGAVQFDNGDGVILNHHIAGVAGRMCTAQVYI